jgi:hypothetical protein
MGAERLEDGCWTSLEVARRASLTGPQLAQLASVIETYGPAYYTIGTALEGDRLFLYDMVQRYYSDDGHGDGRLLAGHMFRTPMSHSTYHRSILDRLASAFACLGMAYNTEGRSATLAKWEAMLAKVRRLSEEPLWELKGKYAAEVNSLETDAGNNLLLWSQVETLKGWVCAPQKKRTIAEGTLTALAILRYRADKGTLPERLDDLVQAGYLKEVLDRYSGKPFIYERKGDDFILYSVGEPTAEQGGRARGRIDFWPPQ